MDTGWYTLDRENQPQGPYPPDQLSEMTLSGDFYVWRHGMSEWVLASTVAELSARKGTTQPLDVRAILGAAAPEVVTDSAPRRQDSLKTLQGSFMDDPVRSPVQQVDGLSGHGAPVSLRQPATDVEEGEPTAWLEVPDGQRILVHDHWSIGRSPDNNHVIQGHKVSRRHALIHTQGSDERWLVDLGSSNGTFLNGRRISRPTRLKDGDTVRIPGIEFVFRQLAPDRARTATNINQVTVREFKTYPTWLLVTDITNFQHMSQTIPSDQLSRTVGHWFSQSKQIVEGNSGIINKYFDNGYLAFWMEDDNAPNLVSRAVDSLRRLQLGGQPPFRLVVHFGEVSFGGTSASGDESLIGGDVNFATRMEKLASEMDVRTLISEVASQKLNAIGFNPRSVGTHKVPGFMMDYQFFTVD